MTGSQSQLSGGAGYADFGQTLSQTLSWAGVGGVVAGGQIYIEGFSIASASGTDWTQPVPVPVPEPGTWLLFGLGLAALSTTAIRRRVAS